MYPEYKNDIDLAVLVLLVTASYDVFDVVEGTNEIVVVPGVGVHHGIFFFAIIQIVQNIPNIMDGLLVFTELELLSKKVMLILAWSYGY